MRRISQALLAASLLAAAVALGRGVGAARAEPVAAAGLEYQVVDLQKAYGPGSGTEAEKDKLLNGFGKEGWRLAGVIGQTVVFERPRAPAPRRPEKAPPPPAATPPAETMD